MNSSMAELRLVKPRVESSNLSSAAIVSAPTMVSWACLSRRWRDHSHFGEGPVGQGSCLENSNPPKSGSGVRFPLSPQIFGELTEW